MNNKGTHNDEYYNQAMHVPQKHSEGDTNNYLIINLNTMQFRDWGGLASMSNVCNIVGFVKFSTKIN